MKNQILEYFPSEIPISKTRIYQIYQGMKQRCYNPNNSHFLHYGGRGISISPLWLGENGLQNFISWSLDCGYNDNLTIDRIDNDGDYCPENCQWVTQSYNSSKGNSDICKIQNNPNSAGDIIRNILLSQKITHSQLAERIGMQPQSLSNKINRGDMPVQDFIRLLDELGYSAYIHFPNESKYIKL